MPLFNDVEEHGHEVRPLLSRGETLRALTMAEPAFGGTGRHDPDIRETATGQRIQRHVAGAVRRSRVPRWLVGIAAVATFSPSWGGPSALFRRWLGGRVIEGEPGSLARTMQAHLLPYGDARYLAVTDRNLYLLCAAPITTRRTVSTDTPLWTESRSVVAGARRAPRLFSRARVALTFTDGSRIVLSQGPFHSGGWHATQVAAALSTED